MDCKPGFADSRSFILKIESRELAEKIKKYAEYYQGSYFVHDAVMQCNYRLDKLQSVQLLKIDSVRLTNDYRWTKEQIQGTVEFLIP